MRPGEGVRRWPRRTRKPLRVLGALRLLLDAVRCEVRGRAGVAHSCEGGAELVRARLLAERGVELLLHLRPRETTYGGAQARLKCEAAIMPAAASLRRRLPAPVADLWQPKRRPSQWHCIRRCSLHTGGPRARRTTVLQPFLGLSPCPCPRRSP